jgi:hypothetical protein
MENNRFVVLTGHLSNYPLSDLVGILRHQRKSGRLLIEYTKGPATFFFQNGELLDARMNELTGLQAICVALAQPEASFNFNPLIVSPRRSIDPSLQRAVAELFGCWDESAQQIESTAEPPALEAPAAPRTLSGRRSELLALPPGPSVQKRSRFLVAAAVVMVVGLTSVIAVTGGFNNNQAASAPLPQAQTPDAPVAPQIEVATVTKTNRPERKEEKRPRQKEKTEEPAPASPSIKVVMQIENGRVLKASIANPRPGMDSYEALALRIARQRRFPATSSGAETVTISVNK